MEPQGATIRVVLEPGALPGSLGLARVSLLLVQLPLQPSVLLPGMLAVSCSSALCLLGSPRTGAQWLECGNTMSLLLSKLRPSNANYIALNLGMLQTWLG